MGEFDLQKFEDSGRENGFRYWVAHDFMRSLGYENWSSFQAVITKAMGSCARLGLDPTEAFVPLDIIEDGHPVRSYKLSRFACFLVSMHGDSKKEEVAKAKVALAAIADRLIEEKVHERDIGRIEAREDLKLAEKVMSGVAQKAGLEHTQFGIFKDAGFRGMYNMSLTQLMRHKGVDQDKTLYDFMGLDELAGNLFRVTQTAARVKNKQVSGLSALTHTASAVGQEVRQMMISNMGTAPESLPVEEDISKIKGRLKKTARAMKKLDGKPKKVLSGKEG